MKADLRKIIKRRKFSEDFKRNLVKEFEQGKFSVKELSVLHHIATQVIYRWIYKYSNVNSQGYRVIELTTSSDMKVKELQKKIQELEQIIGKKQIKIDYLEKLIELASEDLKVDIKKNSNTPQSGGFKSTKKH